MRRPFVTCRQFKVALRSLFELSVQVVVLVFTIFSYFSYPVFAEDLAQFQGQPVQQQPKGEGRPLARRATLVSQSTPVETTGDVLINVRIVEASNSPVPAGHSRLRFDGRVQDLSQKLGHLPYNTFRMLASQTVRVPLKRQYVVQMPDGNKIRLRLHYKDDQRMGIWLRWKDVSGMEVLDTRMHFDVDDCFVTGVEGEEGKGLILTVRMARE